MAYIKHTPGPWHIEYVSDMPCVYGSAAGDDGVGVPICRVYKTEGEWQANARLIKAAPLLLEALESCVEYIALVWDQDPANVPGALYDANKALEALTED